MERIVIEVNDETAKRWRMASRQRRQEIEQQINIKLAKELFSDSNEEFKLFLDEFSATMKARGLTEEKLNEILNDE